METPLGRVRPLLVRSSSVTGCRACDQQFKWYNLRYHCRACGKVFCSRCCTRKIGLAYKGMDRGRVCDDCFTTIESYRPSPQRECDIGILAPYLFPLDETPRCMECADDFSFFKRGRHCRACGRVLCARCRCEETKLRFAPEMVPVCRPCHRAVRRRGQPIESNLGIVVPYWTPDSEATNCSRCEIHFTAFRRRHHCRACGGIFCGRCSSRETALAYLQMEIARVCNRCHFAATRNSLCSEEVLQTDVQIRDSINPVRRAILFKWANFKSIFQKEEPRAAIGFAWSEDTNEETSVTRFVLCMKITSPDEREFILRQYGVVFKSTRASRDRMLNQLIEFLEQYIRDVDQLYRDTDWAELSCSLAGLASSVLTIIGTVMAFLTLGASLGLNVAGGAIAVCGGTTSLGIHGRRVRKKKEQFRQLKERFDEFTEQSDRFLKIVSEGEYLGLFTGYGSAIQTPISLTLNAIKLSNVDDALSIGNSTTSAATKSATTLVRELGAFGKTVLGAGTVFAVITGALDIYNIYKIGTRRWKGELCDPAQQAQVVMRALEDFRSSRQETAEIETRL